MELAQEEVTSVHHQVMDLVALGEGVVLVVGTRCKFVPSSNPGHRGQTVNCDIERDTQRERQVRLLRMTM